MIILHIGSNCHFTYGLTYQDNMLTSVNLEDGHSVIYISDCFAYFGGILQHTSDGEAILENGLLLNRLPGARFLGDGLSLKFGYLRGLSKAIEGYRPDIILYHGMYGLGLLSVSRYKAKNPTVHLYGDVHASKKNSANNWLSANVLHKGFNRLLCRVAAKWFDSIFYIGGPEKAFGSEFWRIPPEKWAYLPLGGYIPNDEEYWRSRKMWRDELCLSDEDLVYVFSGKIDSLKRLPEMLRAFSSVETPNVKFLVAGEFLENRDAIMELIEADSRITYLGWLGFEALSGCFCASDVYLQLGGPSASFQNAICCRCAGVASAGVYSETLDDAYWRVTTELELKNLLCYQAVNRDSVTDMREASFARAKEIYDYKVIAKKIYE